MNIVEVRDVWEKYRVKFISKGKVSWEEIWALEGVSLSLAKGEVLGIIGENGAGKTTLLRLIAGMLMPDKGQIYVQGKVSTLMELGAGFNPEFTGRENILLNARPYGFEKEALEARMEEIVSFAGLGKFIDAPIKYYSQGMYMRLVFSLAIFVEPDVFLIDDILAVGDEEAQKKCLKKIFEMRQAGKSIIVVSHDMHMINKLCDRVILLSKGRIVQADPPQKVIPYYLETIGSKEGIGVLASGLFRIIFNNGRIFIRQEERNITGKEGGFISFFDRDLNAWSSSLAVNWRLKAREGKKITAEGTNLEGKICQIWAIAVEGESMRWQIEFCDGSIQSPHINLYFNPAYGEWVTAAKKEKFSPFAYKFDLQEMDLGRTSVDLVGCSVDPGQIYPCWVAQGEGPDSLFKLFNTGYEQESRLLQYHLNSKASSLFSLSFFEAKDKFDSYWEEKRQNFILQQQAEEAARRSRQEAEEARLRALRTLSCGDLTLFADVEKKALRLYYKDKELTAGNGVHASFLVDKIWYDSVMPAWEAHRKEETLELRFFWPCFDLIQDWRFSFKENLLCWSVEGKAGGSFHPDIIKFGLFLVPAYKTFFCGHQQGEFPEEFTAWQTLLLENPQADLFGTGKANDLPAITLTRKREAECIVQNSDFYTSCRALQLTFRSDQADLSKYFQFETDLSFLEDETSIDEFIQSRRAEFLLRQQAEEAARRSRQEAEEARLRALRTLSCGDLTLFADVEKKALRLYYKDKELTAGNGVHASFLVDKIWYDSTSSDWLLQRDSCEKLTLTATYSSLELALVWSFVKKGENILEISTQIRLKKRLALIQREVALKFNDSFHHWATPYENGDFMSHNHFVNDMAPVRLKENKVSQVALKIADDDLSFGIFSSYFRDTLSLYKLKEADGEKIVVNFSRIIPKKDEILPEGEHEHFAARIVLGKDTGFKDIAVPEISQELKEGSLSIKFLEGSGKISWKGREITKGLGVYTSVRSHGIWYDSHQAVWEPEACRAQEIRATGHWPHIPISQHWHIRLARENLIFWSVETQVHEEADLEIEQANVMLSDLYKIWKISGEGQEGVFLEEFTKDYDILPYRFWYGGALRRLLRVEADQLPPFSFEYRGSENFFRGIVENSDHVFKARLLQYQRTNSGKVKPGRHSIFEGAIIAGS